jgi:acetyl esterase/lipase
MSEFFGRRDVLKLLAAAAASAAASRRLVADDRKTRKQTFVYKTIGSDDLKADVLRGSGNGLRPVVVWIHGGALMAGNREAVNPPALHDVLIQAGYTVVSIDYRLAPEAKLPAILEDLQDACRWVRTKGPGLLAIDANRLAVAGESAGGYLTLAAGFRVEPRPRALISFWGYGDIAGAWLSRPDPYYRRMPLVSREAAYRLVGGPSTVLRRRDTNVSPFILYCRQQGLWPKEVTGHDPDSEPKAFDAFCPIRNVSPKYPPTLLIHGTKDTDVPYEQSTKMAKELARQGVEHGLLTIPEGGHGLVGGDPAVVAKVHERVLAFLGKHLTKKERGARD